MAWSYRCATVSSSTRNPKFSSLTNLYASIYSALRLLNCSRRVTFSGCYRCKNTLRLSSGIISEKTHLNGDKKNLFDTSRELQEQFAKLNLPAEQQKTSNNASDQLVKCSMTELHRHSMAEENVLFQIVTACVLSVIFENEKMLFMKCIECSILSFDR